MSKMDDLRAMREARYARATARAGAKPAKPEPQPPVAPQTKRQAETPGATTSEAEGRCGHRSMNGRTCTREAGHAAKTHRYS